MKNSDELKFMEEDSPFLVRNVTMYLYFHVYTSVIVSCVNDVQVDRQCVITFQLPYH